MPATELIITRHGEAHCNREQIIGGPRSCRGLTDQGRGQIEHLARRLNHEHPIHALYTTPLRRARESAAIIGTHLGLDAVIAPDLAEQDYGTADGRPWSDVVAEYGGIPALEPDRPIAPGAETWRQYLQRSCAALANVTARHNGELILVVGHGETVTSTFHHFFGLPATSRAAVAVAAHYASMTTWAEQPISVTRPHDGTRWTLMAQNDTRHLAANYPHAQNTASY